MAAAVQYTCGGRLGEIDLKQVRGDDLHALGPAPGGAEQARGGHRCQLRVPLHAHHRRTEIERLHRHLWRHGRRYVRCALWL